MNLRNKSINSLVLFAILTICSACSGQSNSASKSRFPKSQTPAAALEKTVPELAKGIGVIFQDSKDNYWFAGDQGVYKYDGKKETLFTKADGLCSAAILGIQEDKLGNIYFDGQGCVSKYDGQKITTLEIIDNRISREEWKLEPNDLWFRLGWDKSGPYRYDGKVLYHLEFPKSDQAAEFYNKYQNASYNPYGIYSSYTDSKGNLWFGTASLGLCRYDGESVSWLYEEQLTKTASGGDFGIRSIIEDSEGYFWFCNTRNRFEILPNSSEKDGISFLNYRKENGIGISNDSETEFPFFMSIVEDEDGDLWMATYDGGVWRNDGKQLIHYSIENGNTDVLLSSIYIDNAGALWLASRNTGLYKFNGQRFEKFAF